MLPRQIEMALLCGVAAAVLAGGVWLIAKTGWQNLLPMRQPLPVPQIGAWCLLFFLLLWIPQPYIAITLVGFGWIDVQDRVLTLLTAQAIAFPFQFLAGALVLHFFPEVRSAMGLRLEQPPKVYIAIGFATLIVCFPPTQAVHQLVLWIRETPPDGSKMSEHNLVKALNRDAPAVVWILSALEAIVFAPIREEVFFRGALQSWLIPQRHGGALAILLAAAVGLMMRGEVEGSWNTFAPSVFAVTVGIVLFAVGPIFAVARDRLGALGEYVVPRNNPVGTSGAQIYRSIVGTAVLFAMFHSSSWPDPIPLTILGLGLGWLAWRTQSIIGCIVCHSLFNAMTVYMLRMIALRGS
jgi:membrane protease YdiL (CAAX protease family)